MNIFTVMDKIVTRDILQFLFLSEHFTPKISVNTSKHVVENRQKNSFTVKETVTIKSISFNDTGHNINQRSNNKPKIREDCYNLELRCIANFKLEKLAMF